jgi:hypothetical protein
MLSSADSFDLTLVITIHLAFDESFMAGLDFRTNHQIIEVFVQEGASEFRRRGHLINGTEDILSCYYHIHRR